MVQIQDGTALWLRQGHIKNTFCVLYSVESEIFLKTP